MSARHFLCCFQCKDGLLCAARGGCALGGTAPGGGGLTPGTATGYPDDNPKTQHGVKKTPLHLIPPPALVAEAWVFGLGASKYGPFNWREHTVSASVYQAAALRHLLAWWQGEDTDPESGQSHLAHARACLGIVLDAGDCGKPNDDRPIPKAST